MDLFLALLQTCKKLLHGPGPSHPAAIQEFASLTFFLILPDELHLFGDVLSHVMQMSGEGDNSECNSSSQTKSHNPRVI